MTTKQPAGRVLDLDHFVPFFVGVIANKLVNGGSILFRRHFGVGFTEWRILAMLAVEPGIAANRICQIVGMDKAAASRGLSGLRRRGLVRAVRNTTGRRTRGYVLTERGRALHDRLLNVELERERKLLARLKPREVPILLDMLRRMLAQIPAVDAYEPGERQA